MADGESTEKLTADGELTETFLEEQSSYRKVRKRAGKAYGEARDNAIAVGQAVHLIATTTTTTTRTRTTTKKTKHCPGFTGSETCPDPKGKCRCAMTDQWGAGFCYGC